MRAAVILTAIASLVTTVAFAVVPQLRFLPPGQAEHLVLGK
jgi:hypothetical protein